MFCGIDNRGGRRRWAWMRAARLAYILALVAALLLTTQPAGAAPPGAGQNGPRLADRPAGAHNPGWNLVESPNIVADDANTLYSVAAVSPNDVWAAGWYYTGQMAIGHPLIEHWNGASWSIVPSPDIYPDGSYLFNLSAVAANDVWAAGAYCSAGPCSPLLPNEPREAMLLHWDGTAWSVVPLPDSGGTGSTLQAVAALSSNDVWAAGMGAGNPGIATRILHYDGTGWSVVANPQASFMDVTFNMTARAADDIWIVGMKCTADFLCVPRTEHYDGATWSDVAIPAPADSPHGKLFGISARSKNDAWAAGLYLSGETLRPILAHWDGRVWTLTPDPVPELPLAYVVSVVAVSPNDAWAAGVYLREDSSVGNLMLHWDGHTWQNYPVSSPGAAGNELQGLAVVKHNELWAVGLTADTDYPGPGMRTQIQHYTIH